MTTRQFKSSAMRRHLLLGTAAAWVLSPVALLSGCGGAEAIFIPFISFTFDGTGPGGQTISFTFFTDNPTGCAASGRFTASSKVDFNGGTAFLTGTFNGRRMDISFAAPPAGLAAAYTGEFIDDATVRMTPVGGGTAFNVTRSLPRLPSCPASG